MFERADGTIEFRRSPGREVLDMVGWPLGALMFLGFALAIGQASVPFALGMGFFGLLMALVSPAALRRGRKPILLVSPRGIATPESGLLPWSKVAEVRIEAERAMGEPGEHPRRIGIVPVAGGPRPDLGLRTAGALIFALARLASLMRMPGARDDHAPFSVGEWELPVPIERAVEVIERYVPVIDLPARAARRVAVFTADADRRPLTAGLIGEIDGRLASPATPVPGPVAPVSPRLAAATRPITTYATFRRRPMSAEYTKLAEAIVSLVLVPGSLLGMASEARVDLAKLPPLFLVAGGLVALFVGVRALLAFARATRARRGLPATLIEVGPDGIRTPESGSLAWGEIADVHLGGRPYGTDHGPELVFVPHDLLLMPEPQGEWSWRAAGGRGPLRSIVVRGAELDGDFERFVDLVRSYRPVAARAV